MIIQNKTKHTREEEYSINHATKASFRVEQNHLLCSSSVLFILLNLINAISDRYSIPLLNNISITFDQCRIKYTKS